MKAYTYENTLTNIPNFENNTHMSQRFGYGYETATHFVHFYGKEEFYILSPGLTVTEGKNGKYHDWILRRFGSKNIVELDLEAGNTIEGIWRPSLFYWDDIQKGININPSEQRSEEQAIRILVEKLDELLLFIEPSTDGLNSYSHKTRELLILACTEVENQWRALLNLAGYQPNNKQGFTTEDYVKILPVSFINEYQIDLKNYKTILSSNPFQGWNSSNPTKSLTWYDAYNKTKHSRDRDFSCANLKYTIDAVAANLIMYFTRFGALIMLQDTNTLAGLFKQLFELKLYISNRKSFYIPELVIPTGSPKECQVYDSYQAKHNQIWTVNKLVI